MSKPFVHTLTRAIARNDTLLCVGLDPDLDRIPGDVLPDADGATRARVFCQDIIERTADLVCAYKPNFAFFEQFGPEGLAALRDVIAAVPQDIPVLLDAKRGDIGNTARAYARAAFEVWGADAITVNPYLGEDSVTPFLAHEGAMVFLLCHTSNPAAAAIQHHGEPALYQHIAALGQTWGNATQVGYVVGATQVEALRSVRALAPDRWLLAPGVGAQGGDLALALEAGLDAHGSGVIVPVSRGVLYADDPRAAAQQLCARINQARAARTSQHRDLVRGLFEAGCVRFGSFTLASGQTSPVYVDLRRVISYPDLFQSVVAAYLEILRPLHYDRLAAVPYAALPAAAAAAMQMRRPMIYPRKASKDHGTGQAVEGAFESGQVVLVLEDVVTSGGSLLSAIGTLEGAGLEVRDVVVLVDREQGGRQRLTEQGYRLHAVLTLREILDVLRDEGDISTEVDDEVRAYLAESR